MKRREFNQLATGLVANVALGGLLEGCASIAPTPGPLVTTPGKGRIVASSTTKPGQSIIRILDWNTYEHYDYDVPLDLVHSVVVDKADKDVVYAFEVFGSAARVNLRTGSITKIDHRRGKEMFNGHGALSAESDVIACSEVHPKEKNTSAPIRLRSTKDLSVVGELPQQYGCHQIISLAGTTMFAAGTSIPNAGVGIVFYDYVAKKIVSHAKTPGSVVHVVAISPTEVIGACRDVFWDETAHSMKFSGLDPATKNVKTFQVGLKYNPIPLAVAKMDGSVRLLTDEARKSQFISNFGLSVTSGERFVSTHTWADKVFVWKDFKIQHEIDVKQPLNVTISTDGTEFMLLTEKTVRVYSMSTAKMVKEMEGWPPIMAISGYA